MTKLEIINEIRRTAAVNKGEALGADKFETETGIGRRLWLGKFWARWGDALVEAGFAPNTLNPAHDEKDMLERYAKLAVLIGRLPAKGDLLVKTKEGHDVPHWETYSRRFGGREQLLTRLREHCEGREDLSEIRRLCDVFALSAGGKKKKKDAAVEPEQIGYVYLMKSAKYYKIGKANTTSHRHRELAIQMPERLIVVHEIKTDDPFGIEAYWHNRFADRRKNGEWFDLKAADVATFKRRKFM